MLKKILQKAHNQKGITGLETAIILIAFVVVAAVFAYTVLSAGLFSSEKGSEAVYTALEEVQSSMELRGGMTAYMSASADGVPESLLESDNSTPATTSEAVTRLQFSVANALGGEPIDLTPAFTVSAVDGAALGDLTATGTDEHETIITYQDDMNFFNDCAYTVGWIGDNDGDWMLEPGEQAQVTVWLVNHAGDNTEGFNLDATDVTDFFSDADDAAGLLLDTDHTFTLEVKTPSGAVLAMERTTPAELDPVMDLH